MNDSVYVSVTSFLALNLWLTGRAASGSGTVTTSVYNCLRRTFTNDICNEGGSKFCGGAVLIGCEMRTRKRKEVQKSQNFANITCK